MSMRQRVGQQEEDYWLHDLERYRTNSSECFPIIRDMMQREAL